MVVGIVAELESLQSFGRTDVLIVVDKARVDHLLTELCQVFSCRARPDLVVAQLDQSGGRA